jgi:hypothetical protein
MMILTSWLVVNGLFSFDLQANAKQVPSHFLDETPTPMLCSQGASRHCKAEVIIDPVNQFCNPVTKS